MPAIILSIGDELTSGLTPNTNASWLSQRLAEVGITSAAHITIPDQLLPIVETIREAIARRVDLLLITGGLGPTEDDLTRQALADALNEPLIEDPSAVIQVERWFRLARRPMSASNRLQALRPQSAEIIENRAGTAPGLRAKKDHTTIFVMPGVPAEMRAMFDKSILPELQSAAGEKVTLVSKINTFGRGESIIGEAIKDLMLRNANPAVGTTAHEGIVSVRIYATAPKPEAEAMTDRIKKQIYERIQPGIIFGEDDATPESAVAQLLRDNRLTLATAESCTGGLLAKMLTDIPGSSAYFLRGWVTYANAAKHDDLAIPNELITEHGAVSEPVALAMAEGAKRFAASDYALATTGIAGPEGGTPEKPVGTVWIGLASPTTVEARRFIFPGDRKGIRLRAAQMALAMLRWRILNIPAPV